MGSFGQYLQSKKSLKLALGVYLALALYGGFLAITSMPYGDLFDGYLNFYLRLLQGDIYAWFDLHNEHRILLSRLLFWFSLRFLPEQGFFLISTNYLLSAGIFALLLKMAHRILDDSHLKTFSTAVLFIFTFSWFQYDNFISTFQSQFFLAQLVPVLALFYLYKSMRYPDLAHRYFIFCLTLAMISVGTMANGILVFPSLLAAGILFRIGLKKWMVILLSFIFCAALYFINYKSNNHAGPINLDLISMAKYFFAYMGGPIDYILGHSGPVSAMLMGTVLCIYIFNTWIWSHTLSEKKLEVGLLLSVFIFISLTAAVTALGRHSQGAEQALSSRYTTPSLIAWSAVFLLFAFRHSGLVLSNKFKRIAIVVGFLFFIYQFKAIENESEEKLQRQTAILALAMGINDTRQIHLVYPIADRALDITAQALQAKVSVFKNADLQNAKLLPGSTLDLSQFHVCSIATEILTMPSDDSRFFKVRGYFPNNGSESLSSKGITIADSKGQVFGYALTYPLRSQQIDFQGYLSTQITKDIFLFLDANKCQIPITALKATE